MSAPFSSVRVLDISRVHAESYCAQMLADQGADVIKVESPEGDENRVWSDKGNNGMSCTFNSVKRGITLNLKSSGRREVLHGLMARSDVVIHSSLPDAGSRLGIDYPTAKDLNPNVVFCSISSYGKYGPMRNRPGYDLMMQAFARIMSITDYEGQDSVRVGPSFIDMSTGLTAYGAITTALFGQQQTGEGA